MNTVLTAALAWHRAGVCVVPAATDGTKRPQGAWKEHITFRPDVDIVCRWFGNGHPGIGLITGAVSGNLEMLEFEGRAVEADVLEQFEELIQAAGLQEIWEKLGGYCEVTPSGGLHYLYRVEGMAVPGNTKLAKADAGEVLIETRGEGGFVVVAPSGGPVHPTGLSWNVLSGGPETLPTLTAEERHHLHTIARHFDRAPAAEPPAPAPPPTGPGARDGEVKPGDDFEARATWAQILEPAGWVKVHTLGKTTYWRRPGKNIGTSATTGHAPDRDRLYVFSSSTDFEPERSYTKFAAWAVIHHDGDYSSAAAELSAQGYGHRGEDKTWDSEGDKKEQSTEGQSPAQLRVEHRARELEEREEAKRIFMRRREEALFDPEGTESDSVGISENCFTSAQLDQLKAPAQLIEGMIATGSLVRTFGPAKSFKSFIALDQAHRVSLGLPWNGRATRQVKVLYIVAEGAGGIRKRVRAWEQYNGQTSQVIFYPRPLQLGDDRQLRELYCTILHHNYGLVLYDTQARCTVGVDENGSEEMGYIIGQLDRMRAETGACMHLVHHSGVEGGRGRGTTAWDGAVDAEFEIRRDKIPGTSDPRVSVVTRLQKDMKEAIDQFFDIELVDEWDSVVPVPAMGTGWTPDEGRLDDQVLGFVASNPGCGRNEIRDAVPAAALSVTATCERLEREGRLIVKLGQRRKQTHYLQGHPDSSD